MDINKKYTETVEKIKQAHIELSKDDDVYLANIFGQSHSNIAYPQLHSVYSEGKWFSIPTNFYDHFQITAMGYLNNRIEFNILRIKNPDRDENS